MFKYFVTADGIHIDVREMSTIQLQAKLVRIEHLLKDPEVLFVPADDDDVEHLTPKPETKEWYKRLRSAIRKEIRRRKEIETHLLGDL